MSKNEIATVPSLPAVTGEAIDPTVEGPTDWERAFDLVSIALGKDYLSTNTYDKCILALRKRGMNEAAERLILRIKQHRRPWVHNLMG